MPTKAETKKRISEIYESFISEGFTVSAACRRIETRIKDHAEESEFYRQMRNDMSTHLGSVRAKFDPAKHTHGFANL
jgi:uncharacterized protein (UPF0335 family)